MVYKERPLPDLGGQIEIEIELEAIGASDSQKLPNRTDRRRATRSAHRQAGKPSAEQYEEQARDKAEATHTLLEKEFAALASRGQRSEAVQAFVRRLVEREQFSVGWMRRTQNQEYVKMVMGLAGEASKPKPNGLHISEMYDANFMVAGKKELPEGTHGLKLAGMIAGHVPTCELCLSAASEGSTGYQVHPDCYFHNMMELRRCGWNPVMEGEVVEQYDCSTGNRNTVTFKAAYDEQMESLLAPTEHAGPVLKQYYGEADQLTLNRPGLALKASCLARARALAKIDVVGPESLAAANAALGKLGGEPIKARLTTDATGSGVNSAAMVPAFSYPTINDAVSIVRRGDCLGKGDVARYYMLFPLAEECQHHFGVQYRGLLFYFTMLFFGFAAGAYYASVWSAELRRWVLHRGVRPVHMMDDWMVSERDEAAARAAMGIIAALFTAAGIYMAPRKYEYGQQLLFLGILFDTVRMSMSFDAVQSRDFARILREAAAVVKGGGDISVTEVSSIAGKTNWYGSLLQVGRLHDSAWWEYLAIRKRASGGRGREEVGALLRQRIVDDSEWWIAQLETWAKGGLGGNEFPILSSSELLCRADAVEIVQSDASGPDGCGYLFGALSENDPEYFSRKWRNSEASEHSTTQELAALLDRVRIKSMSETLIVWVSDSASAVYCINKGRGKEAKTHEMVGAVLGECDRKGFQIVGLWVPREQNLIADHLSHLAHNLNRDSVTGRASELGSVPGGDPTAPLPGTSGEATACHSGAVHPILPGGGAGGSAWL